MYQAQPLKVLTNLYEIAIKEAKTIYCYRLKAASNDAEKLTDAKIIEEIKDQNVRQFLRTKLGIFFTKETMIYSPTTIGEPAIVVETKPELVLENVQQASTQGHITPNAQSIITRLIKQVVKSNKRMITVGQKGSKLFFNQDEVKLNDLGISIWPGFQFLINFSESSMTITLDYATKVLRMRTLFELYAGHWDQMEKDIVGTVVRTAQNNMFYSISEVLLSANPGMEFERDQKGGGKEKIKVGDYMQQKYKTKVQMQPLLVAYDKNRDANGDIVQRKLYLLPQFCYPTGIPDDVRKNFKAMKQIDSYIKINGVDRRKRCQQFINECASTTIHYRNEQIDRNLFENWGIEIKKESMEVQGNALRAGSFEMGNKQEVDTNQDNLERALQKPFFECNPNRVFNILAINQNVEKADNFANQLAKIAWDTFKMKFQVKVHPVQGYKNVDFVSQVLKATEDLISQFKVKPNMFLFMLNGGSKAAKMYNAAKQISFKTNIPSQCVVQKNVQNANFSVIQKIIAQMYAKLSLSPWVFNQYPKQMQVPTMVCGTDVFHKAGHESHLAFCSTMNPQFSKYYSQHVKSEEFCKELHNVMKNSLEGFFAMNKVAPHQIIIYRDGVGKDQENIVIQNEQPQYREAITAFLASKNIQQEVKLVIIICNKRVSTKFFMPGSLANPQPGTLIDDKRLVGKKVDNYYLVSQKEKGGGTLTPTHYKILINDLVLFDDDKNYLNEQDAQGNNGKKQIRIKQL